MQPLRPIFSDGCVVHSLVRDYGSTECKRRRRRFWTDPAAGRLETPLHPCLTPLRTKLVSRPRKLRAGGRACQSYSQSGAVSPKLAINGRKSLYYKFRRGHAYAPGSAAVAGGPFGLAPRRKCPPQSLRVCWAKQTLIEKRAPSRWNPITHTKSAAATERGRLPTDGRTS